MLFVNDFFCIKPEIDGFDGLALDRKTTELSMEIMYGGEGGLRKRDRPRTRRAGFCPVLIGKDFHS